MFPNNSGIVEKIIIELCGEYLWAENESELSERISAAIL